MLIVPELKLIFIRPQKVAGKSLQIALLSYLGYVDEEAQVRYRALKYKETFTEASYREYEEHLNNLDSMSVMQIRRCFLDPIVHISAEKAKKMVPEEIWNNYLKVSVVRCPYDTAISYYCWHRYKRPERRPDFYEYVLGKQHHLKNYKILCIGNRYLKNYKIPCIGNRSAVDFIIRYENIEEDIQKLERKLEIPEGGILELFKRTSEHTNIRPPGETVRKVYSEYPLAYWVINKGMNENIGCELIARYYPAYKKRFLQQFPPAYKKRFLQQPSLGYFLILRGYYSAKHYVRAAYTKLIRLKQRYLKAKI